MNVKSPQFFFLALLMAISIAIGATVLLANDKRNLRQLLLHFGVELTDAKPEQPAPAPPQPAAAVQKTMLLPEHLFLDLGDADQTFSRVILTPPEAICDRLRDAGFANMERQEAFARKGWECSVLQTVGDEKDESKASSIFVFIRVDGPDNRVESFRIKMNIARPEDKQQTLSLAVRAADVFLRFVRWDASGEITQRIAGLEEFDITRFGSRIRLKREMGDVPRYNFYAAELPQKKSMYPSDTFFDRHRWMPISDAFAGVRLPASFSYAFPALLPLPRNDTSPAR